VVHTHLNPILISWLLQPPREKSVLFAILKRTTIHTLYMSVTNQSLVDSDYVSLGAGKFQFKVKELITMYLSLVRNDYAEMF
jgi:hypothetical protein